MTVTVLGQRGLDLCHGVLQTAGTLRATRVHIAERGRSMLEWPVFIAFALVL